MWHIASVDAVQHPVFLVRADPGNGALRLFGELDIASAPDLRLATHQQLHSYQAVTIDVTALAFIDAAGLGTLVTLRNRCLASGTRLVISGASTSIARVFALANLADLLTGDHTAVAPSVTTAPLASPLALPTSA